MTRQRRGRKLGGERPDYLRGQARAAQAVQLTDQYTSHFKTSKRLGGSVDVDPTEGENTRKNKRKNHQLNNQLNFYMKDNMDLIYQ